jgi:VCBS repeat-containing protein
MEPAPTIRRTRKQPEQAARHCRSTSRQEVERTAAPITHAFLKAQFPPLYGQVAAPPVNSTETQFFASLDRVANHYGLAAIDVSGKPYPYNVLLAHHDAQRQLTTISPDITLTIQEEDGETCLCTKELMDTGNTLYYIPVLPLYRLMQDKKEKRTAELLLSVCAYLYRHAGVRYYRNDYEYIESHYSYMEDWYSEIAESEGDEYAQECLQEINAAKHYGDIMQRRLHSPYQIYHLAERIENYHPVTEYQREALQAAKQTLALLQDYPNECIFRHTSLDDPELYDDEVIQAHQYISFVAETSGSVYRQIEQSINEEFGNCALTEMPTLTRHFDSNYTPNGATLDFERRVFALLENICFLLMNTP